MIATHCRLVLEEARLGKVGLAQAPKATWARRAASARQSKMEGIGGGAGAGAGGQRMLPCQELRSGPRGGLPCAEQTHLPSSYLSLFMVKPYPAPQNRNVNVRRDKPHPPSFRVPLSLFLAPEFSTWISSTTSSTSKTSVKPGGVGCDFVFSFGAVPLEPSTLM